MFEKLKIYYFYWDIYINYDMYWIPHYVGVFFSVLLTMLLQKLYV